MLAYKDGEEEIKVFKCSDCYAKNPSLTNFRPCEVYSRIVGYLRPVQQWNVGKKKEFKERKEYKAVKECC
ncbi:MAG: anaerobic ribonucleoside-triphosphate reductase [bacterium]|nr:anaerobic ribonucleoside-triphosphate reductase [bacterium]